MNAQPVTHNFVNHFHSFGLNEKMFLSLQKYFSMKKAIGIGLLLLANMVLLVHTVIPHHHAGQSFNSCEISFHKYDAAHHCKHFTGKTIASENDGHAHNNFSLEECLLDNIYVRFVNHSHVFQANESDTDADFLLLYFASENPVQVKSDYAALPFRRKPYLESLYTSLIAQSTGLRAPPFC